MWHLILNNQNNISILYTSWTCVCLKKVLNRLVIHKTPIQYLYEAMYKAQNSKQH
jgi:hypothetical protein